MNICLTDLNICVLMFYDDNIKVYVIYVII